MKKCWMYRDFLNIERLIHMGSQNTIRVLQVLSGMDRAGAETMLMNLYRAIDRDKVQFDFAVTITRQCDYDEEIESLGGRIIHYPRYTGKNHFAYKRWWVDFFKTHPEYKIVHGHIGSTAPIYLQIAKKFGCYTIAHSHNTRSGFGLKGILYKIYSYPTRFIADYFIGCSQAALKARYGNRVANNKDKSTVLNNGIDVSKYIFSEEIRKDVCEELQLSKDELIIGTVGRLNPQKNPLFTIEILNKLKEIQPDFKFLWAGTGEMYEEIQRLIKLKNLQNNVILLGVRNDIPRILQALNVFILPSLYEGLPVIGVEVQAAGVPMLCSDKVSEEVNISKCCEFLSIDAVDPWVKYILNEIKFRRIDDAPKDVISAGYDINNTSKWLTSFYIKNLPDNINTN